MTAGFGVGDVAADAAPIDPMDGVRSPIVRSAMVG